MASLSTAVNRGDQPFGALVRRARRSAMVDGDALGRQPRAEQRLADIDIADPRDDALIEQRGFQAGLLAAQARASIAASNSLPSGSGPSPRSSGSSSSSSRATIFMKPKRRGSLKVTMAPIDM